MNLEKEFESNNYKINQINIETKKNLFLQEKLNHWFIIQN